MILGTGLGLILVSICLHSVIVVALSVIWIIIGEGLFEPTFMGKLSQSMDESKQGKLQGVNQSLQSANNVLIPLGAAAIYYYSPGMLYSVATFFILFAVYLFVKYIPPMD